MNNQGVLRMNLLTIESVNKSYTERILFNQITFGVNQKDKIGVIGVNGTGKSTLLKMIAGLEQPDTGVITRGKEVQISYLSQNPQFDDTMTILENVTNGIKGKSEIWNVEGEAKAMLEKLGIREANAKPSILSGGQRKRAALVQTLLSSSNVLILDEPTNHLDNQMAEWLENYLNSYSGALLMVTHDRYFLDAVTNRILEIDKGKIYSYDANYSKFLQLKEEREEMLLATERKNKSLYKKDLEWMMRGARARSTKQKAHIQRFEELRDRKKPEEERQIELNSLSSRLGKSTIEVNNVSKSYDNKILIKDFSYIFLKTDRIGIIGANGCGKSTLLKMITGIVQPDYGEVAIGQTVEIGYFAQENDLMDGTVKVIDSIREVAEYVETKDGKISASQMLERFLFDSTMQYSQISKLSGGEKRRLYLLKVLMTAPNILILDEPTNDLDIQTLTILEDYLDHFNGIVIAVSHDRYFLDRVVTRIFAFEGNGIVKQFEGTYSDYWLTSKAQVMEEKSTSKEKKKWVKSREQKLKFTYMEQKEFDEIDAIIADLEAKIEEINKKMLENSSNYGKLNEWMKEKEMCEVLLEEKMERWMYLNELAEKMEQERKSLQ